VNRRATINRFIGSLPLWFAGLFFVAFIAAPLLVMLFETVDAPGGLSLSAYSTILADKVDRTQLLNSLELGVCATAVALVLGFAHAWLTHRTDLPLAKLLGPLGIAPLVIPPIFVAMGFADLIEASGFWVCSVLLGLCYAPFVAIMTARGLRAVDGRCYEAALLARGRGAADRLLVRSILPEVLAGCLFAFIFVVSEHGVPEFLTVKGKTWHTYAEGIFGRWTRRATGSTHEDIVGPIVAALPLVAIIAVALAVALRLRAHSSVRGDYRPLPVRRLGKAKWPALLAPLTYLGLGVGVPLVVMARWAAGSTQVKEPMSLMRMRDSFRLAWDQAGGDLTYTLLIGIATTVLLVIVAVPLARRAAQGRTWIDYLCIAPVAVPAILLAIGFVRVYNSRIAGVGYDAIGYDFYDSGASVVAAYAARLLPFGVLTLSHASRRLSPSLDEAALLSGRGPVARALHVYLPLIRPAAWSAACIIFILALRELDVAVVLLAGNGTVVRRLSNVVHFGGEDMGGALALLLLLAAVIVPLLTVILTGRRLRSLS